MKSEQFDRENFEMFAAKKLNMSISELNEMLDEHQKSGFDRYNLSKCCNGECFNFADSYEIWIAAIQSTY